MTYTGLRGRENDDFPHLGGNALEGDVFTYSPTVWNYLIDRFAISSVLDVGSGLGHCANYFFRKGIKTISTDGLDENVKNSLYPTVLWDLTKGPFITKVDLVHCQEVVEHVEEKYVQNIIDTFKSGKYICMTHAIPNQPGHHHVNCQWAEYWIDLMEKHNCYMLHQDSQRIRQYAQNDDAIFLRDTGLIFCNRDF